MHLASEGEKWKGKGEGDAQALNFLAVAWSSYFQDELVWEYWHDVGAVVPKE